MKVIIRGTITFYTMRVQDRMYNRLLPDAALTLPYPKKIIKNYWATSQ